MAEGARFENPDACETMEGDAVGSFSSQSVPEEAEEGSEPIGTDR